MKTLKVVTFNIRCDCEHDGKNQFKFRKALIEKKIKKECPDIIGFQEIQPAMLRWFKDIFVEYHVIGCGRDKDYSGEHVAVAYRKENLEVIHAETFWLSKTPDKAGTRFEKQSIYPRICTGITFKHEKMEKPFRYYNTHLDHEEEEARLLGLRLILDKMQKEQEIDKLPVILTGDFNAWPDSKEIQMIKEYSLLEDCTSDIKETFHDYGRLETPEKIDYIYRSKGIECSGVSIWDEQDGEVYLSDHYPVEARLVIYEAN